MQVEDFIKFLPLDIGETVKIAESAGNHISIEHFDENKYNIKYHKDSYVCDINFDEVEPCYINLLPEEMIQRAIFFEN